MPRTRTARRLAALEEALAVHIATEARDMARDVLASLTTPQPQEAHQ